MNMTKISATAAARDPEFLRWIFSVHRRLAMLRSPPAADLAIGGSCPTLRSAVRI
jgi:hypothetical protein